MSQDKSVCQEPSSIFSPHGNGLELPEWTRPQAAR